MDLRTSARRQVLLTNIASAVFGFAMFASLMLVPALLAIASTAVATGAGRAAFSSLLKFIPGAGTLVGGAIGAGVASSFTYAMGHAWLTVCQRVVKGKLGAVSEAIDTDAVRDAFLAEFRKKISIRKNDRQPA